MPWRLLPLCDRLHGRRRAGAAAAPYDTRLLMRPFCVEECVAPSRASQSHPGALFSCPGVRVQSKRSGARRAATHGRPPSADQRISHRRQPLRSQKGSACLAPPKMLLSSIAVTARTSTAARSRASRIAPSAAILPGSGRSPARKDSLTFGSNRKLSSGVTVNASGFDALISKCGTFPSREPCRSDATGDPMTAKHQEHSRAAAVDTWILSVFAPRSDQAHPEGQRRPRPGRR